MKPIYFLTLTILAIATLVGVFCVPSDELPLGQWFIVFWLTKSIGFGAGYLTYKLTQINHAR